MTTERSSSFVYGHETTGTAFDVTVPEFTAAAWLAGRVDIRLAKVKGTPVEKNFLCTDHHRQPVAFGIRHEAAGSENDLTCGAGMGNHHLWTHGYFQRNNC